MKKDIFTVLLCMAFLYLNGKEQSGTITFEVLLNAPENSKEAKIWLPLPVTDDNQTISDVKISGNYTVSKMEIEPVSKTAALYAEWNGNFPEKKLTYSFSVKRNEITEASRGTVNILPESADNEYLTVNYPEDTRVKLQLLAREITGEKTAITDKAQAVYNWIVDNFSRNPETKGCGTCQIDRLLVDRSGKCADIHAVFTALARTAGVPVREISGLRMHKEKTGEITKFQHCWTEYHQPGNGWIPVDPADVLKFKLEKKPVEADLQKIRDYYFGSLDENRVAFNNGSQVLLKPAPAAGKLLYFMYPHAEADGKVLNEDLFGFNLGYKITFKEE